MDEQKRKKLEATGFKVGTVEEFMADIPELDTKTTYEQFKSKLQKLHASTPRQPQSLTKEEMISWIYGTCKLSNDKITREMARKVVDAYFAEREGDSETPT